MGFRVVVFLVFVLLLAVGKLCSAQNPFIFGTNETLHQIEQKPVVSTQLQNQTERSPVTYQLKTYQLRTQTETQKLQKSEKLAAVRPDREPEPQEPTRATEVLAQSPDQNLSFKPDKKEPKVVGEVQQQVPVPAESVSVHCGEEKVTMAVKRDFLGNGQLIHPRDLTLGGCLAVDAVDHILLFQTELHGCGSNKTITEEFLIYSFSLIYSPTPIGNTSILKTNPAEVTVQCHFKRRNYVSSNAMRPTWTTFASEMQTNQQLQFSLRLMSEDWLSRMPYNAYFLREIMNIEASVLRGNHVPLRLFVDSCVATAHPDPESTPRYPLVTNHGCLTDAKLTGAKSYFMPRSWEDKLHLQLEAFRFQTVDKNSVYITCSLKATTLDVPLDLQHKTCSFLMETKRWVASGGDNQLCSCCETSCDGQREKRSLAADTDLWKGGAATLDPILPEDRIPPPEPAAQLQTQEDDQDTSIHPPSEASTLSTILLCGAGAMLAVALAFMSAVICSRLHKPSGHAVRT
ncbi:zona pellucida sperm-binding protein 3 [Nothobranchius furzeri]|uniref:Zona pellucida sperm-binding protein 3 n=1 Tax=Nothobranchius furzeri TaxID=105023 RepID=A0A9D2Y6N5_NOTFU|nr:zona pellucida sperm-binding protein 3 [Nothobranchius furzeri]KAF7214970.1 zona pellucida sperm-binding protein 3-like [Nothobranchius furzeri]